MIIKEYEDLNGIKIFNQEIQSNHSDYNSKRLDNLYQREEKHFWFLSRKEFILENMQKYISKDKEIMEVGAGTGNVSRYIFKHGYKNISVGEMHLRGLNYAQKYGIKKCYQFDLLDTPFENEFDVICMFDVLEHIDNDSLALENIHKSLKKDGKIVLTVPSHMWLWNRDDKRSGHKRRYIKKELVDKLEKNGFEVLDVKYFFISILPLLYLRTLMNSDNEDIIEEKEHDNITVIHPLINKILLLLTRFENKINRFLPNYCGGSLFLIGKKI